MQSFPRLAVTQRQPKKKKTEKILATDSQAISKEDIQTWAIGRQLQATVDSGCTNRSNCGIQSNTMAMTYLALQSVTRLNMKLR